MSYSYLTFADAKTLLAARLDDPSKLFWVDAELSFALKEARRLWNVVTGHDRETGKFNTSDGVAFYQLASVLTNDTAELIRAQTIRDRTVVSEMQYHLMEAQGLEAWAGTDQFTFNQVLSALQRRRDQFLADTACVLSVKTEVVGAGTLKVSMPDTVVGVRRAVFATNTRYYTLRPSDVRFAATRHELWSTPGEPATYDIAAQPNLQVRLIPPPITSGTLETVVVETGATLNTAANGSTGTLLGVPDDYVWGVKYGALADLLRDANSSDADRADYCEQMYQLAVSFALNMPVVLWAAIDGYHTNPSAITYTDMRYPGWQGMSRGAPTVLSTVGPDYVALTKVPDSNPHQVHLDVVRTAVLPATDADYLDIGREHLDVLLGMAQRICMFKVGGEEFLTTDALAEKFFDQAARYSNRRSAASTALQVMRRNSSMDMGARPWERTPRTIEDRPDEVKSERNARRRPFRK